MSDLELMVFFDESGKKTDRPTLMGGLSIPAGIYTRPDIQDLRGTEIHWVAYSGHQGTKEKIKAFLDILLRYESVFRMNVINYDQSMLEQKENLYSGESELAERIIYTKFPERIIYGLLRKYGKYTTVMAELVIEEASNYRKYDLPLKLPKQLNEQSIYRGESFHITGCRFASKGEEVGVELTDLLLGIIRTIIKNSDYNQASRRERTRIDMVLELLRDPRLSNLLESRIKYFEWSSGSELNEVDIKNYLKIFLINNHEHIF